MWVWPMLVLVGVLILGYASLRLVGSHRSVTASDPDGGCAARARRRLDARYARGDLDDEQYRRARAQLW